MQGGTTGMLDTIFNNLTRWRNLPKYQLERRADIFFSLYLKGLLEEYIAPASSLAECIIPEFPLIDDPGSQRTVNVDYVLFSRDLHTAYFVELKTDLGSRREKQDAYLISASNMRFQDILFQLVPVFKATIQKKKYYHLMVMLQDLGFITMRAQKEIEDYLYTKDRKRVSDAISCISIENIRTDIKVIYLQPGPDGESIITFKKVAQYLERFEDEFSQLFRKHILLWDIAAASIQPSTFLIKKANTLDGGNDL